MVAIYWQAVRNEVRKAVRAEIALTAYYCMHDGVRFIKAAARCKRVQLDCLGPMIFSLAEPGEQTHRQPLKSKQPTLNRCMVLMSTMQQELRLAVGLIRDLLK